MLVACPENSVIESKVSFNQGALNAILILGIKDFLQPIVTPFELEVALQAEQSWTGRYVLNFEQLIADASLLPHGKSKRSTSEY